MPTAYMAKPLKNSYPSKSCLVIARIPSVSKTEDLQKPSNIQSPQSFQKSVIGLLSHRSSRNLCAASSYPLLNVAKPAALKAPIETPTTTS